MTNKSIRDYINLIENAQSEEVSDSPLVRHIEKELTAIGYKKGTPEFDAHFKDAIAYYRQHGNFGNADTQGLGEEIEEGWTKLPSGDYQNSYTGVRSSKPPVKKKRGEKTGAEWDAIEKAKKDKESGVAEGSDKQKPMVCKNCGKRQGEHRRSECPKGTKTAIGYTDYGPEKFEPKEKKGMAEGLNEFAPDRAGDDNDGRSKFLGAIARLFNAGNRIDWRVLGQMGNVVQVNNDGITMKPHNRPHSKKNYFLPMDNDSMDTKYTIKMVGPRHYEVVGSDSEEQLEETTPEAMTKVERLFRS